MLLTIVCTLNTTLSSVANDNVYTNVTILVRERPLSLLIFYFPLYIFAASLMTTTKTETCSSMTVAINVSVWLCFIQIVHSTGHSDEDAAVWFCDTSCHNTNTVKIRSESTLFVISSFHRSVNGIFALLVCYTPWNGSCQRFGAIYRHHLQGSNSLGQLRNIPLERRP